jgi:hypothetical protein
VILYIAEVFHDWDSRRTLQPLADQEELLEKQNILLRMVHQIAEKADNRHIKESSANLTAETYLMRGKLCSLMGKHNEAVRNLHLSRQWNLSPEFKWEISFEEVMQFLK